MTRWKLPELDWSGEFDGVVTSNGYVDLVVPEIAGYVRILRKDVTEVKPPLPPEPPAGSVAVLHEEGMISRAFLRSVVDGKDTWRLGGVRGEEHDWAELHEMDGSLTPLVPAPPPVTLPWESEDHARDILKVEVSYQTEYPGHVFLHAHGSFITPHRARDMANALLTAADEADRRVSDATP